MTTLLLASLIWSMSAGDAVELRGRLERLARVGRVMYVAAHPDDENTHLLSYLVHGRKLRTQYLSLTRGDGGQNLIGDEQSPLLGVIRTHELLAARRVDGAEQAFTRARDFGYSKRADEALAIWGHEVTLGDVVWAIRRFRPHVVITRFPEEGSTHGHHLASAILAREAFAAAADPERFPHQRVKPWQATRLVFNVPTQFMPDTIRDDDLVVDIGGFDEALGQSYGEIAATSRSMHKSQGFGAPRRWGPHPERFRHLAGEPAKADLLDGIETSWRSVPGGEPLAEALERALEGFRIARPAASVPAIVAAMRAAESVADPELRRFIRESLARLALDASGLLLEARAESAAVVPGATLPVKIHATLRGSVEDLRLTPPDAKPVALRAHEKHEWDASARAGEAPSVFPWLAEAGDDGRYRGPGDPDEPLPPPPLTVKLELDLAGVALSLEIPVEKVWVDPVAGERRRLVEIAPPITVTPDGDVVMLPAGKPGKLRLKVRTRGEGGRLRFDVRAGYRVEPASVEVKGDAEIELTIHGPEGAARAPLRIVAEAGAFEGSFAEAAIDHAHLPLRTVLLPAVVDLVSVDLEVPGGFIGHIPGPGDRVASSLRRVGFDVRDIDDATLAGGDLGGYDAILVGIRAFNTNEALRAHAARLSEYAERGGTVVVQYATKHRTEPLGVDIGPHALSIGRGRVTDERGDVKLIAEHPLLSSPHRIGVADFEGWVQERGLYFAESWGPEYTSLLSMADRDEAEERGALLVADVGEGRFVYTGLSLFRQLPAGVPGAYRLAANLLSRRGPILVADDAPPVLGAWKNLYALVIGALMALMVVFYLLTRHFRS
jgi:LmbE family N-acetylglucosaminyl deacetylase